MSMGLDLKVNLSQNLSMQLTPSQRLSLEVLQLNVQNLEQKIEEELESNPLLELAEPNLEVKDPNNNEASNSTDSINETLEESYSNDNTPVEEAQVERDHLDSIDEYFEPIFNEAAGVASKNEEEENDILSTVQAHEQDFEVYIHEQVEFLNPAEHLKPLIEILVSHFDERGYFERDIQELFDDNKEETQLEDWHQALDFIKSNLDPAGIGASTLKECLILQLNRLGEGFELERKILEDHFDDLLHNRMAQLAKSLEVGIDKITDAVQFFKGFSFRPAAPFHQEENQNLTPDAYISYHTPDALNKEGKFIIELSKKGSPRLEVTPGQVYKKEKLNKDEKQYINNQVFSGKSLIEAIRRRNETLFLVIQSICQYQKDFFEEGKSALKPLLMQDISKDLEMSAATITRTVKDKVVQTDFGTFPLKYFFSLKRVKMSGGEVNDRDDILEAIKEIINNENKRKPLSDAKISKSLAEKDFKVAVRTISKYRDMLDIPSSSKRKQF